MRRPRLAIVTPQGVDSNSGNWHTAKRWAHLLGADFNVSLTQGWDGAPADAMIALHARRSAASIHGFAAMFPDRR